MEGLGINWKILIGQLVNFAVLFFLLKKFVFKKFSDTLRKRTEKIEDGLNRAQEAEKKLSEIRALEEEVKEAGERRARETIKSAQMNAEKKRQEILALAEKEKERIVLAAKETAAREAREARENQRQEALEMSFLLAEKFLKEKFDSQKDKKFIEELGSKF